MCLKSDCAIVSNEPYILSIRDVMRLLLIHEAFKIQAMVYLNVGKGHSDSFEGFEDAGRNIVRSRGFVSVQRVQ